MTTTITELSALLERVEGAECKLHNDDVGRLICLQEGVEFGRSRIGTGDDGSDELSVYAKGSECSIYSEYRRLCLDCSIDAAVEFFEAVLPGWCFDLRQYPKTGSKTERYFKAGLYEPYKDGAGTSTQETAPLAIIAATLRAKIAEMETTHAK